MKIQISTTPIRARMKECRNAIGPASSRTVRRPRASLPSDRPWVSVSSAVGTATSTSTVLTRVATAYSASSAPIETTVATR